MAFFSGTYDAKLDPKGRLVLPARLKSALPAEGGSQIILFKGFEACLYIYSPVEWKRYVEKISALNPFDTKSRKFQRDFLSRSIEAELDSLGRFLLPRTMLEYAGLEKDVRVLGAGDRIELWNPEKLTLEDGEDFSELAGQIFS